MNGTNKLTQRFDYSPRNIKYTYFLYISRIAFSPFRPLQETKRFSWNELKRKLKFKYWHTHKISFNKWNSQNNQLELTKFLSKSLSSKFISSCSSSSRLETCLKPARKSLLLLLLLRLFFSSLSVSLRSIRRISVSKNIVRSWNSKSSQVHIIKFQL